MTFHSDLNRTNSEHFDLSDIEHKRYTEGKQLFGVGELFIAVLFMTAGYFSVTIILSVSKSTSSGCDIELAGTISYTGVVYFFHSFFSLCS